MSVGDYIGLADTQFGPRKSLAHTPMYDSWAKRLQVSPRSRLLAYKDAVARSGRYPVVIYVPGAESVAWDNADLCEYLAGHGYVVIAGPSLGERSSDVPETVGSIIEQARDISFLIDYAATLPNADTSYIAVAGWSWGGISNVVAGARDPRIKALVALDGSLRYYPKLVHDAGVRPDLMTVPLLAFTQGNITLEQSAEALSAPENQGPNVLNAWTHADRLLIDMLGMSHPTFSSMVQRRKSEKQFAEDKKADYDRNDTNSGYAWVARYTLAFLDAYLKREWSEADYFKREPKNNGVPQHSLTLVFRKADPRPIGSAGTNEP